MRLKNLNNFFLSKDTSGNDPLYVIRMYVLKPIESRAKELVNTKDEFWNIIKGHHLIFPD
jgi:hypothetical protein